MIGWARPELTPSKGQKTVPGHVTWSSVWFHLTPDSGLPVGCFTNVSWALQNNLANIQCQKSHLRWEFQAETFYMCPKHGFGHTYKVSARKFHTWDFCNTKISREYIGELTKHYWNNPQAPQGLESSQDFTRSRTTLKFWSATMFRAAARNFGPLHKFELPTVIADSVSRATRVFSLALLGHVTGHMVSHMVPIGRCRPPYWEIFTVNNLATVF